MSPTRLSTMLRGGERVSPLELFFDLAFVLAVSQCTALMAREDSWEGLAKGLLILGVMWWAWVGYAWLTNVVDPGDGVVRVTMFIAMTGMLIVALSAGGAFSELAVLFTGAYAVVRGAHVFLFLMASRDDPLLRRASWGLASCAAASTTLLACAAFLDGELQGTLWAVALAVDVAGPLVLGVDGWQLVPGHFVERHGLVMIIALGELVVAISVGSQHGLETGVVLAAALGMTVACLMWWIYFDSSFYVPPIALSREPDHQKRNLTARDAYSYLHLPLVAAVVLVALGVKHSIAHTDDPLEQVAAFGLVGGFGLFLLAHAGLTLRTTRSMAVHRVIAGLVLLAAFPLATLVPALLALGILAATGTALMTFEALHFAELRAEARHLGGIE